MNILLRDSVTHLLLFRSKPLFIHPNIYLLATSSKYTPHPSTPHPAAATTHPPPPTSDPLPEAIGARRQQTHPGLALEAGQEQEESRRQAPSAAPRARACGDGTCCTGRRGLRWARERCAPRVSELCLFSVSRGYFAGLFWRTESIPDGGARPALATPSGSAGA